MNSNEHLFFKLVFCIIAFKLIYRPNIPNKCSGTGNVEMAVFCTKCWVIFHPILQSEHFFHQILKPFSRTARANWMEKKTSIPLLWLRPHAFSTIATLKKSMHHRNALPAPNNALHESLKIRSQTSSNDRFLVCPLQSGGGH